MLPTRTKHMEEDGGVEPQETTFTGTPNAAPEAVPAGAFDQQPQVQYASKSPWPIIIGAIYSLFQVLAVLASLAVVLGGALLSGFASEVGEGAAETGIFALVMGVLMLVLSSVGVYAGILMIRYKKRGIHIALALLALGVLMDPIMNVAMDLPVTNGMGMTVIGNGVCALIVAIPLMVSGIAEQMED